MCIFETSKTPEMQSIQNLVLSFLIKLQWLNQCMKVDLKHLLRHTSQGGEVLPHHLDLQEEVIQDIEAVLQQNIGPLQEVVMNIEDMITMIEDTPLANTTAIRREAIIRVAVVGVDIIQGEGVNTSITNPGVVISPVTMDQEEDFKIGVKDLRKTSFQTI
jgi:hypothetical protein